MARGRKGTAAEADTGGETIDPVGRRSARLRLRAAWMYHVEDMTQTAIADALGVGRVTVVRLLADARRLNEVRISLSRGVAELPRLEMELERVFDVREAVVAPLSAPGADPTAAIGAAAGQYVSGAVRPGMRLGVGWGRTLVSTLGFLDEKPMPGMAVVSLLGGISAVHQFNPAEFAWQFSRLFQADCTLIAAPALVDSVGTKRALVEHCGVGAVFEQAANLDAVLLSVGGMVTSGTSHQFGLFSDEERRGLLAAGAVGDLLYNFFDEAGAVVDHPLNARVMSVPVPLLVATPERILMSGGPDKVRTLLGAMKLLRPTVLITDEVTARALLEAGGGGAPVRWTGR